VEQWVVLPDLVQHSVAFCTFTFIYVWRTLLSGMMVRIWKVTVVISDIISTSSRSSSDAHVSAFHISMQVS
jgi:hypothetical protein